MLKFAQDMVECRKMQFAKYFSVASEVAISAWTTAESDALSRCGHCDNCKRSPEEVVHKDVTLQAWQLVKIAKAVNDSGANVTLKYLADLARGNAGGAYEVSRRKAGKGQTREKYKLDLEEVAGGEVYMSKDEVTQDIEHLLVDLVLRGYLKEKYLQTPYSTNVYVECGPRASILYRHTQQSLETAHDLKIESVFRRKERKSKVSKKSKASARSKAKGKRRKSTTDSEDSEDELYDDEDDDNVEVAAEAPVRRPLRQAHRGFVLTQVTTDSDADIEDGLSREKSKASASSKAKGKRRRSASEDNKDDDDDDDNVEVAAEAPVRRPLRQAQRGFVLTQVPTDSDEDIEDGEWFISFTKKGPPPRKKPRISASNYFSDHGGMIKENDRDVIVLSDN
ncbi:hypothetical protein C0993_005231 [Termitomyces sp. T159_Od127]|nr:hypothetical protein C0993_005231 [Termitomyces sp. T159_Od127]